MKGLVIKPHWADLILDGAKDWEIRGAATHHRGPVAIIPSGSGLVVGLVDLVDCVCLSPNEYAFGETHHRILNASATCLPYARLFAWVLSNPRRLPTPKPYRHPRGAIIWVRLPDGFLTD